MTAPAPPVARRPLRTAVLGSIAGKAAELVTLVALATVVPRVLGPTDFGRFSVLLTIVTVGTGALALGGTTLQARFVPAAPASQRRALAYAVAARLARLRAGVLAALAVVAVALVVWDPATFQPVPTALTFLALTLAVFATLSCQAGLGLGRITAWNLRYPVHNAVLVLAVVWLYPRAGVPGSAVALVLAASCMLAVGAIAARGLHRPPAEVPALPDDLRRFGRLQGAGWALSHLTQRGGVLLVALLAGSAVETGYAALAIGAALPVTYAVLQLFTVALPRLAADTAGVTAAGTGAPGTDADADAGRPRDVGPDTSGEGQLRRLAGAVLAVVLPAAVVVALLLPRLVAVAFGDGYAPAARSFAPALGLVVLSPLLAMLVQVSALRLRAEATSTSALAGALSFLLVAVGTVPLLGALGATTATAVGAAVTAAVGTRRLPGAVDAVLGGTSFLGAGAVVALALAVSG